MFLIAIVPAAGLRVHNSLILLPAPADVAVSGRTPYLW
jgi:hypothetical protein